MTHLPRCLASSLFAPLALFYLAMTGAASRAQSAPASSAFSGLEMPRAGAPRVLRLIDAAGRPLSGSFSEPRWETGGAGLFFTRDWGGTRNVWRAFPDPQDANRYPTWRALPVTQFQAPLFAASASPVATSGTGQRTLLMVSNATDPRRAPQVVSFDWLARAVRPLTESRFFPLGSFDPAPSPYGSTFAFAASVGGVTSVYIQNGSGAAPRRVALNARHPEWQNGGTLLIESVANRGVFQLSVNDLRLVQLTMAGTQASASRDGSLLSLLAPPGAMPEASQRGIASLYLMAGDGSGLRSIAGTKGAQHPTPAPDGRTLAFDAPVPGAQGRALWVLPLEREVAPQPLEAASRRRVIDNPQIVENAQLTQPQMPVAAPVAVAPVAVAQISGVRRQGNALAILGVATGENASATLEIGVGNAPKRWTAFRVAGGVGGPLGLWTPPPGARGLWTLRLSVTGAGGTTQSVFQVRLPLDSGIPTPVVTPANPILPSGGLLPRAPMPNLPAPPALPALPAPAPVSPAAISPAFPNPVFPAQPNQIPSDLRPAPSTPRGAAPRQLPLPAPFPPATAPVGSAYAPPNRFPTPRATANAPQPSPQPSLPAKPKGKLPEGAERGVRDGATFNISGTLANMSAGQRTRVTFWGLNRGNLPWNVGSSGQGAGAVRLVARWVDADRGTRRLWSLKWMKTAVAPGERTNWDLDLVAPTQPGRYKLIYGLIRLPDSDWHEPAYNAPQESWPHEFAAIAFAVTVKP